MSKVFDCIVLGVGGMGSAALYYAVRKGWRTLGLDRFPIAHDRGSSHGRNRIIRQAYFEHPNYVPMLLDAYQMWGEIESESGQSLFEKTGLLQVGSPDGPIIGGIRASAQQHNLTLKEFATDELRKEFPLFNCREGDIGLLEENAGFLRVEKSVAAFVQAAQARDAEIQTGVVVNGWSQDQAGFQVSTDSETFRSRRLIVTAGSWAKELLPAMAPSLKVIAKHQHWFRIADQRTKMSAGCPTYFFETDDGYFYGFPEYDELGCKIAEHSGGREVDDPLNLNRDLIPDELARVQNFAHSHFNSPRAVHQEHSVCLYTMSPDEHFIVDRADNNLTFACGMSGHGFKFAPVIGQALVNMVDGQMRSDMAFLRANRFNT